MADMTDMTSFSPKRVLVCQQRQIGDVLLTTPALALLRARWPDAQIHVLTERKCAPMLDNNPHVDQLWLLDKKALPTLAHELRWHWQVTRTRFDLLINFQPTLPRLRWPVAFSALHGTAVRVATTPPWYLRILYSHTQPPAQGYAASAKAALLEPLGITWQGERPRLYLRDQEREAARTLLAKHGVRSDAHPGIRLVTVDPTHRQPSRRWPLDAFARCMALLAEGASQRGLDLRFLPLWGPGEEEDMAALRKLAQTYHVAERLLLPERMLSLRESAACMAEASLHLGNCSAPRHIAVAVNTPTCIVRGSTGAEWAYPAEWSARSGAARHVDVFAGLACQPCERNHCDRPGPNGLPPCLSELESARVAEACLQQLFEAPHL